MLETRIQNFLAILQEVGGLLRVEVDPRLHVLAISASGSSALRVELCKTQSGYLVTLSVTFVGPHEKYDERLSQVSKLLAKVPEFSSSESEAVEKRLAELLGKS